MQEAFLDVNGIRTNVCAWGRWVEEPPKQQIEDIVLFIPGNPGVTTFYNLTLTTLYDKIRCPVWTLSHAGHQVPREDKVHPVPPLAGNEKLFSLKGQTEHKAAFIEKYVPKTARLHLVGHSIGTRIILELLKIPSIKARVVQTYLLFPTIENMALTKNGIFMTTYIKKILPLIIFFCWIFTLLPKMLSSFLLVSYMKFADYPKMQKKSILNLLKPEVLRKIFYMAFEEMEQVKDRPDDILKENVGILRFYYALDDGWVPDNAYDKLKKDIPELDVRCCNFAHTFIFHESRQIANILGEWINERRGIHT